MAGRQGLLLRAGRVALGAASLNVVHFMGFLDQTLRFNFNELILTAEIETAHFWLRQANVLRH